MEARPSTTLFCVTTALVAFAAPATAANLLTNGGFENPGQVASYITHSGASLTGWTVTGGNVDTVTSFWVPPSEGSYALDLDGLLPGTITQTIATIPGQNYTFSIDILGTNTGFDSGDFSITGIGTLFSQTYTDTTDALFVLSTGFVADSASTTLTISSNNTNGVNAGGLWLDNASITGPAPIPEPARALLLGLGILTALARRRRA